MSDPTPRVTVDPEHGHITIAPPGGRAEVTLTDLGSVLNLWAYTGMNFTPELARSLGEALIGWADKKNPPPADILVTLTGGALGYVENVIDSGSDTDLGYLHTLRIAVEGDAFKIKANDSTWSPPLTDGVLIQKGHEIP
jgi:hypothetical protein